MRYASKSELDFYNLGVISGEIEILLNKIRMLNSEIYTGYDLVIPEYLAKKGSFNIYGLINANTYDDILELVKGTVYYKTLIELKPKKDQTNRITTFLKFNLNVFILKFTQIQLKDCIKVKNKKIY